MPDTPIRMIKRTIRVFCSYTHADELWRQKLDMHFKPLIQEMPIECWHDRKLQPGIDWAQEVDERIDDVELILLLVSPAFMSSDYWRGVEIQRALERHHAGEARVLPILLSPCDWETAPFATLQTTPSRKCIAEWSQYDEAAALALVVKDLRDIIARLLSSATFTSWQMPDPQSRPSLSQKWSRPPIWNVPFPRNPFFTGREEQLAHLREELLSHRNAPGEQIQAISGPGGIGKTQLVVEYAYRQREDYQAILWVRAKTLEVLNASYSELATLLDLPQKNAEKQEEIVQAVKIWLEAHRHWLLILDDLDDLALLFSPGHESDARTISPFLPSVPAGHLLVTTRSGELTSLHARPIQTLTIGGLPPQQSLHLLLRYANLLHLYAREGMLSSYWRGAERLAREIRGLPLALQQAGAYLAASGISLTGYLFFFFQRRADLFIQNWKAEHPESVTITWGLALEHIEETNPAAAELLRACAFLAPDAIPEELFTAGAEHLGVRLKAAGNDLRALHASLETLHAYALITRDPQTRTFTVHPLVQTLLRASLDEGVQQAWMRRVIQAIYTAFPRVTISAWPSCERLLPHALRCARWTKRPQVATPLAASLLNETGIYLNARGRYAEAEQLFKHSMAIREQLLGSHHVGVAESQNHLASSYLQQGKYGEAEALFQSSLSIRELRLGPDHAYTAISLNNLARLYNQQGRYAEAEPLLRRALSINEKVYRYEHEIVAANLNDLATVCQNLHRHAEAGPLYRRALEIREQRLGPEHPDTASSLNNLANLTASRNQPALAETLYLRALRINEQHYGPNHPAVATNLINLAVLYEEQKKRNEASMFYLRALQIQEQTLGAQHPSTGHSLFGLARVLAHQKRYREAREYFERALSIYATNHGEPHPALSQDYQHLLHKMARAERYRSFLRKWSFRRGTEG